MSNTERAALIEQANQLGLEFHSNIPTAKLQVQVDEALDALPSVIPEPVIEEVPPSPAMKAEPEEEEVEEILPETMPSAATRAADVRMNKELARRLAIKRKKDAALKTRVVTITNKDNRENDVVSTAYLSFENQHFGLSKLVPLDVPIELEQALISVAESCVMTLPKDEIIDGKRTGNKTAVRTKKYVVSYSSTQPE